MIKQQVVNEIHKAARKNFIRRSVMLKGIDDLWQADLIDFQDLKKFNSGFNYILVVIDCFSKFAWAVPVKSKTKTEISNAFASILQKYHRHPNYLQTDKGTEFYNDVFRRLLLSVNIKHYSTYSTKKASIVERFIKTLKNNLFKKFSLNGNYKWVGKQLNDVMYTYNNTKHSTTNFKPSDVDISNTVLVMKNIIKSQNKNKKNNFKNKFDVGDYVRISKYKKCFEKGYTPNWSTEIFTIKKVNNTCPITYLIEDQQKQPILGAFYEQELQKTKYYNIYLIERVIKKKGNKLFVKWLGLNNDSNSWIDKNAIVN